MYTVFMTKNSIPHTPMLIELNRKTSPDKTRITPEIIGFRTWAYKPVVTNLLVGSQGANVPLPILKNIRMVINIIDSPTPIIIIPIIVVQSPLG